MIDTRDSSVTRKRHVRNTKEFTIHTGYMNSKKKKKKMVLELNFEGIRNPKDFLHKTARSNKTTEVNV